MKKGKENSNNHLAGSIDVQARKPFQDITNVVASQRLLDDKHGCIQVSTSAQDFLQTVGHSVARTQHSVNPLVVCRDQNTSSTEYRDVGTTNTFEKKRYNNRDRYSRMTPEQRDVFLRKNRECKRSRRQNHDTKSDVIQSADSHTITSIYGDIGSSTQTITKTKVAAVGDPSIPSSEKSIFQESLVNPVTGTQIMINPYGLSKSYCISKITGPQKRTLTCLNNSGEDMRRALSDEASCSSATQSSTYREKRRCGYAPTIVGKSEQTAAYLDMGNDYKRRQLSNGVRCSSASQYTCGSAMCSTVQNINGNTSDLLGQYVPAQMQPHVTREEEYQDDTIYTPRDCFPAVQDETGKAEDMIDNSDEDEEGNVCSAQGFEYDSYQELNHDICGIQVNPYDRIYQNLPSGHHVLKPIPNCVHCNAKRFQFEKPTFCCMGGRVKIVTPHVPAEVRRLYTSQDSEAKYFQDNKQYFNSHFSFTSLGVILDQRYCNKRSGVYTFRAQGQVYHRIDQLVPMEDGPKHLQLYFYDTDADLQYRFCYSPNLDRALIKKWVRILRSNPYAQIFRSLGSVSSLDEYKIELNTNIDLDQRVYNAPTASQVAAIWVEGNDPQCHS